ncbi:MAG: hypothetical protein ABFE07_02020 [Armatimonadia bacterium]
MGDITRDEVERCIILIANLLSHADNLDGMEWSVVAHHRGIVQRGMRSGIAIGPEYTARLADADAGLLTYAASIIDAMQEFVAQLPADDWYFDFARHATSSEE